MLINRGVVKYTAEGSITVGCTTFEEPEDLRGLNQTALNIFVADTGCGIPPERLGSIFREFEKVESIEPKTSSGGGVGLGLAVVARIVEQYVPVHSLPIHFAQMISTGSAVSSGWNRR
jgi:signal transduction histidine kinase